MAGTSWPALVAGTKAKASDVESKFDWLEQHLLPMAAGVSADNTYDLGSSTYRWANGYFATEIYIATVPLSTIIGMRILLEVS